MLLETRRQAKTAHRERTASVRVGGWTPAEEHQYVQGEMEYVGSSGLNTDQGCKLQIKNLHSLCRASWLKARCECGAEETVAPSASASSNSNGEIETESDLGTSCLFPTQFDQLWYAMEWLY